MPLVDILSADRFSTYRLWAGAGGDALGERLYSYNVSLSAELYSSLHMLEVALRNKADEALTAAHGAAWYDDVTVMRDIYQQQCVTAARTTLLRENKAATHGQMVAELNFGFWSSLFGRSSHHLWGTLRPIFHVGGLHRGTVAQKLRDLRQLRNRVAHYEPILARPLGPLHQDLVDMAGWLSQEAAGWIAANSSWAAIHPGAPLLVADPVTGAVTFDNQFVHLLP